jgi:diguanylate cyclase (GGDEF)-like protein
LNVQLPSLSNLAKSFQPAPSDKPFRLLIILSGATVAFTFFMLAAMLILSASRSDQLSQARLHQVVEYALAKSVERVPYDQESVAVWDDAVKNVKGKLDLKWVDINLGVWMYDYFKHDRSYVLNADDQILYSMADGKQVSVSRRLPMGKIAEVVSLLRRNMGEGALERYEKGQQRIPRAFDLGFVEGRPAIVSAMPLVSDTGEIPQDRGTESLIVSVRFLDSSFLPDLAEHYLLQGVRFSKANDVASAEQSYPLRNAAGTNIGYFIWKPDLPGWTILSDLGPLFGIGLLAIGLAVMFLTRRLRSTCTELVVSEAHSKHLAYHDVLTGLPNRAYFDARLESLLADIRGGSGHLALMFLDLDRFKEVNDTFGHAVGDALIREVTAKLSALLRPGDVLARMGGDEFAVIKRASSKREVKDFSRLIATTVARPFEINGLKVAVGVSIGVAMAPEASTDRGELARKADIALYRAKKSTNERFQFFTEEIGQKIELRRALEMELRQALDTGCGLEVAYQAVYAAGGLKPSGAEALVRWEHPRLGSISPSIFVALAEECGLINRLGDWVLRKACGAAQAWEPNTIAVNVSTVQCQQPDFAERVFAILRDAGLSPDLLEIEITESVLLDGSGASARTLKALRDGGVRIALDDFGTGYSSLSYLMKLEVDRIKIDRSFIQNLDTDQSRSIVQAIVTMAKAVNVAVTAEGVETHAQLIFLAQTGCDHFQGYLFSKPVSALQLTELLMAERSMPMLARVRLARSADG